jgi:peptidoglycan/LPS O-acetylase OafA/YrhL
LAEGTPARRRRFPVAPPDGFVEGGGLGYGGVPALEGPSLKTPGEPAQSGVDLAGGKPSTRYGALDGLRGVAAVSVVFYHFSAKLGAPVVVRHGYLAVDFFFILSGFVIAHSYAGRLEAMGWAKFFEIRAKRLLPLSMLGVLLGAAYMLLRWKIQPGPTDSLPQLAAVTLLNLALIPRLWAVNAPFQDLFPTNGVLWSLSLEMAANLIWAGFFVRARSATMVAVAIVGAVLLAIVTRQHGDANIGWDWETLVGGCGRVAFGFFAGVLLWRFKPPALASRLAPWLSAIALVAVLALPATAWWLDVASILVAFPLIVCLGATSQTGREGRLFSLLGELSYPLYAIHLPFIMLLVGVLKKLGRQDHVGYGFYVLIIPLILGALFTARFYDMPVRRWLARWSPIRPSVRLTQPPSSG